MKKEGMLGFVVLFFLLSASFVLGELTWTQSDSFAIYSGTTTLSWGAGDLVCKGTLTDSNAQTITCDSGTISDSTNYRVEVILQATGSAEAVNQDDTIKHINAFAVGGFAGAGGTMDKCAYNDFGSDDTNSACTAAKSGNDAVITVGSSTGLTLNPAAGSGKEGFMYNLTTGIVTTSSNSYIEPTVAGTANEEDSSKITITATAAGATSITACQDLSADTEYKLTSSATATSTCFNITGNNVKLNCTGGSTITYNTGDPTPGNFAPNAINNSIGYNGTIINHCIFITGGNSVTNQPIGHQGSHSIFNNLTFNSGNSGAILIQTQSNNAYSQAENNTIKNSFFNLTGTQQAIGIGSQAEGHNSISE